ncbi:MAG: hypothetical protein LW714_04920 [Oxalobacteraceae bacterium]|jgi:hypothetical protein|nr:hypothetical protein [Oxalobacteraceae bacterium]
MAASIYLSGDGWRSEPRKALVWGKLARINGETEAQAIVSRAGKGLGTELQQEAMQQASVCLQTDYRDCPEQSTFGKKLPVGFSSSALAVDVFLPPGNVLPTRHAALSFKSRVTPCIEVMRADGKLCQGFAPKPTISNASQNSSTPRRRTV